MPNIIKDELWKMPPHPGVILVTANSHCPGNVLVMGAGAAKQAADLIPSLPIEAAAIIQERHKTVRPYGVVFVRAPNAEQNVTGLGLFQTKYMPDRPSPLALIGYSAITLKHLAEVYTMWNFRMNFPGIGCGKLKREQVEPLLTCLPDNVTICYR